MAIDSTPAQVEAEKRYPYSSNGFEDGSYNQALFVEGADWQRKWEKGVAAAISHPTAAEWYANHPPAEIPD